MKKILFVVALAISASTFAQKDELKTLKKIYDKETISEKDLESYKASVDALDKMALADADKVYAKFYKVMYPTVVMASKGANASVQEQMALFNPEFIKNYGNVIDETIEFEKTSGKKIYTDDLVQEKQAFEMQLKTMASSLYSANKFKEASGAFYGLYLFDSKNGGQSLENAAISAVQAQDYVLAEKMYEELNNSDYLKNGILYYAVSKASDAEESFPTRDARLKAIQLGTHEKPREEKVAAKKPEVLKMLALIYSSNGKTDKAKNIMDEAISLNPADLELKKEAARIYFNEGYDLLKDDQKLVEEINANLDKKAKYDELMEKRKNLFKSALPSFEKAYSFNPTDENTKNLLKMTYEMLGMKDKASTIK